MNISQTNEREWALEYRNTFGFCVLILYPETAAEFIYWP